MTVRRGYEARVRRPITAAAHAEELITGIPNEISVARIVTKLPWKSVICLSSVSRGWYHAIRSRQVYDARVSSHSTEKFNVTPIRPVGNTLQLVTANFELPPITREHFDGEIEPWGRIVTLDGKVYVLGRLDCTVHVLDLAGQRDWKQCASMRKPRREFGCGAIEGKIYVFERGLSREGFLYNSEIKLWDLFKSVVSLRCSRHVERLTGELAAEHFDVVFSSGLLKENLHNFFYSDRHREMPSHAEEEDHMEVYDPTKDEWKDVEPAGVPKERMFVAGGKFYSMTPVGIHVYDFHGNSWIHLHSFSFATEEPDDSVEVWPLAIQVDENELLVLVERPSAVDGQNRSCMFLTSGLGSKNKELVWHKAMCAFKHWVCHWEYENLIEL